MDNQNNQENQDSGFDHIPSPEELSEIYRESRKADPSSINYKRVNLRPKINYVRAAVLSALAVCFSLGAGLLVSYFTKSTTLTVLSSLACLLLIIFIFLKSILIFLVKLYQRIAPESLRNKCRFEPSCSQYMIMSINKYGAIKGLFRGLSRIFRCRPPNGGIDLP